MAINIFEKVIEMEKRCIEVAANSPCDKRKVGAVLFISETVGPLERIEYHELANGVNHNSQGGACESITGDTLPSVIHAEIACLNNAFDKGIKKEDIFNNDRYRLFVTHQPCENCEKSLAEYGLKYIVVKSFMKFSHAKPRMALVPPSLAEGCARAMTYGARKYKVNNWRKTPDIEEYISALERHINAWKKGEDNDPESGLNHLDHMAANLAFITELKHLPKIKE